MIETLQSHLVGCFNCCGRQEALEIAQLACMRRCGGCVVESMAAQTRWAAAAVAWTATAHAQWLVLLPE